MYLSLPLPLSLLFSECFLVSYDLLQPLDLCTCLLPVMSSGFSAFSFTCGPQTPQITTLILSCSFYASFVQMVLLTLGHKCSVKIQLLLKMSSSHLHGSMEPYGHFLLHINKDIHLLIWSTLGVEVRMIKITSNAKCPFS